MTRFSPTSGTTSASVPSAAIFTNAGSHFSLPGAHAQRLHELERDADARQVLVRVAAIDGASGLSTATARGSSASGLVVIRDHHVHAEFRRAPRGLEAADAAVHGDDEAHAFRRQPLDGGHLEAVAVADPLGDEVGDVAAQSRRWRARESPWR